MVCLALVGFACRATVSQAADATDKVRFYFNLGPVEIELYGNESPLHVANFLGYVNAGDYDNSFIHRTRAFNPGQPTGFNRFLQGGSFRVPDDNLFSSLSNNPIMPGDPVVNEFDASNGLSNTPGSLAAARTSDPDSARSGWFINQSDNGSSFDPGPFTVFGQVVSGMEIIDPVPFLPNLSSLQGTPFASTPIIVLVPNNNLVILDRVVRIPLLAGDYNFNGQVDAADYSKWRDALGSSTQLSYDGNANGIVDEADYAVWKNNFGAVLGSGSGSASATGVPEPSTLFLMAFAILALFFYRRGSAHWANGHDSVGRMFR